MLKVTIDPVTHPWGDHVDTRLIRAAGHVVGELAIRHSPHGTELEYMIYDPDDWGHGWGSAAVAQVLTTLPPGPVYATILPDNHRSLALAKRLGFTPVHPYSDMICHHLQGGTK